MHINTVIKCSQKWKAGWDDGHSQLGGFPAAVTLWKCTHRVDNPDLHQAPPLLHIQYLLLLIIYYYN